MPELAPLALAQLAAWQVIAGAWPLVTIYHDTGLHISCGGCFESILPLTDSKDVGYRVSSDLILSSTVSHLRNVHRYLDPDKGTHGSQDSQPDTNA